MKSNTPDQPKFKLLFIISVGGMLEAYDFIIYGLMLAYISPSFFPNEDIQQGLLMAFAVFSIGYLSRPLGGLIFGHQGDRHGRKKPLLVTLLLMASATVAIGLLPTYDSVGLWAPALLISLRFTQGLSMGGEVGGAYTYISEVFKQNIGLAIAILASGMELGILLGQGVHAAFLELLGKQSMYYYGWRFPFLVGGLLGLVGYIVRKKSLESAVFVRMKQMNQIVAVPVRELLLHPKHFLCGILLTCTLSISFLIFLVYIPTTLPTIGHHAGTPATGCYVVLATIFANFIFAFWLKTQSRNLMKLAILSLLTIAPASIWLIFNTTGGSVMLIMLCGILTSLSSVVPLYLLVTLFPTSVRYSGISIVYGTGFAIGGVAPLLATWLSHTLSQPWASGYLLVAAGFLGLAAYILQKQLDTGR